MLCYIYSSWQSDRYIVSYVPFDLNIPFSNKSTIPATVRERMVSIKSEASNRPDSNTYEQTDIDDQPPKLFKTLEPCLYPHYETQELAVNGVSTAHTSCYSCTDIIAHPPSNYNRLVYSRSEDDSIG